MLPGRKDRRYEMKFLLIGLVIRFLIGAIFNKKDNSDQKNAGAMNDNILHPAEFDLR